MASGLDGAVTYDCATEFEVDTLEPDVMAICKANVVRPPQPRFQTICTHASCEFVEPPVVIRGILGMHMEVCDRWVVRGVLTEYLCPV